MNFNPIAYKNINLLISFIAVVLAISGHTKRVLLSPSNTDNVLFAISMFVGLFFGIYLTKINKKL